MRQGVYLASGYDGLGTVIDMAQDTFRYPARDTGYPSSTILNVSDELQYSGVRRRRTKFARTYRNLRRFTIDPNDFDYDELAWREGLLVD